MVNINVYPIVIYISITIAVTVTKNVLEINN